MAVDRPSDYVTSHQNYRDIEGMSRTFTMIDHDKKTTVITGSSDFEKEWESKFRAELIERIVQVSPSICPEDFSEFKVRGEDLKKIEWDTDKLLEKSTGVWRLRDLCVVLENRVYLKGLPY